ncbi:hypothetical protein D3C71_1524770 [compost metagenome]
MRQIHALVAQQLRELRKLTVVGALVGLHLRQALGNQRAVFVIGHLVAADANDAAVCWQAAMSKGLEQCGQQFSPCQITGATKQNQIKAHETS